VPDPVREGGLACAVGAFIDHYDTAAEIEPSAVDHLREALAASASSSKDEGGGAYFDHEHECWFVPIASELFDAETEVVEHCRLEFRGGELIVTELRPPAPSVSQQKGGGHG
jgi:hypothetical protein